MTLMEFIQNFTEFYKYLVTVIMRPLRLKMNGIGPYAGEVDIDFSELNKEGLFLITGETGAGKTSIFDGITYALYGKANLGDNDKINGIISDYVPVELHKECYVEFIFELDNIEYRVKRIPKYQYINRNGVETSKSETCEVEFKNRIISSKSEADKYIIEDIIKLNYDQFKKIMMLAQGSFNDFIKANSDEKANILNQIFETDMYALVEKKLKTERDALNTKIESERNRAKGQLQGIEKNIVNNSEIWSEIISLPYIDYNKVITIMEDEKNLKENIRKDKENEKKQIEILKSNCLKEINEGEIQNKEIEKLRDAKKNLEILKTKDKEVESLKEAKLKYERALLAKSGVVALEEVCDKIEKIEKEIEKLTNEIEFIQENNKKDVEKLGENKSKLSDLKVQIESYKELEKEKENYFNLLKEKENIEKNISKNLIKIDNNDQKYSLKDVEVNSTIEKEIISEKEFLKRQNLLEIVNELKIKKAKFDTVEEVIVKIKKYNESKKVLVEKLKQESEKKEQKFRIYEELNNRWFLSEAYKISSKLVKDSPCPVCGSKEHPKPAKKPIEVPTSDELEKAKKNYEKICKNYDGYEGELKRLEEEILENELSFKEKCENLGIDNDYIIFREVKENNSSEILKIEEIIKKLCTQEELEKIKNQRKFLENDLESINEEKNQLKNKNQELQINFSNINYSIQKIMSLFEVKGFKIEEFQSIKELKDIEVKNLELKINETEKNIKELESQKIKLEEKIKFLDELTKEKDVKNNICMNELKEYNFLNIDQCKDALKIDKKQIENDIDKYSKEFQYYENVILDGSSYDKKEEIDILKLKRDLELYRVEEEKINIEISECIGGIRPLENIISSIENIKKKIQNDENEYKILDKLMLISQGKYGDKKNNISFQNYVLRVYFKDILERANQRLLIMTGKQYRMTIDSNKKGNKNVGLELNVFDAHTGKERSIKTLSGGETFKASMALALGLSDVVQEQNGGIKLDSVFIDEGFGTLDEDSLNVALGILTDIQSNGRTVGIISHVNELKEIIPAQIVVKKSENGSRAFVKS